MSFNHATSPQTETREERIRRDVRHDLPTCPDDVLFLLNKIDILRRQVNNSRHTVDL